MLMAGRATATPEPPQPVVPQPARDTIKEAFDAFAQTVSLTDKHKFSSTTLQDVRQACLDVERLLASRRSLRNVARLEPFLVALGHYAEAIDPLCNNTPYLPWIWSPLKLILQVCHIPYLRGFS